MARIVVGMVTIGANERIIGANDERPAAPRTKAHAGRFFGRRHDAVTRNLIEKKTPRRYAIY